MTASITLYDNITKRMLDQTHLLDPANTFKVALVTSSYTPSAAHSVWADVSANEITTAGSYSTGGATAGSVAVTTVTTNDAKWAAANTVWTASGGSIDAWRYAVCYASGTLNSLVNPLLFYILGDTTPANIPATTVGNTLTLTWNASGIITFTY